MSGGKQNEIWSGWASCKAWEGKLTADWWSPRKMDALRSIYKKQLWPLLKDNSGWRLNREIIKYVRCEGVCSVFLLLTVSHTARSPWPYGHCLTFKNHKSLVFLISIAWGKSDFYQCVFKLPCIGAIIHSSQSNRKLVLWEYHNKGTCLIQRNLMTY